MLRYRLAAAGCILSFLFLAGVPEAAPAPEFRIRVDGKILRKASGKLVLSLSAFELGGLREATLENRRTGEKRTVALSSVYEDISYTEPLPEELYNALDPADWLPYIVWIVPDDLDSLRSRLSAVYGHQNLLRRELGNALLDEEGAAVRVSSRLTLNKIEKFHRIAAALASQYLKRARQKDELSTFLYPLHIEIGFTPFSGDSSRPRTSPLDQVREVIYWEVHRILTQQFGIEENLVDFVLDAPATVRRFAPLGATRPEELRDFFPNVTMGGEAIDCALYLQRQGFDKDVQKLVRLKLFRDPFITDRPVVDMLVNEGQVIGVDGDKVAVTFIPPFMKRGETVYIATGETGEEEIPVVLAAPVAEGGFTLSAPLPEGQVARIRPGMPVRRK